MAHLVIDCPHAARCGGCPFIQLPYAEQLVRKRERVTRAFARYPLLSRVPVADTIAAEPIVSYRSRSKLVVGDAGVGLYGPGGHVLVDVPECRVLPPLLAAVAARVRSYVSLGQAPVHGARGQGLRGLDIRGNADDSAALVTLIVDEEQDAPARWLPLAERLRADEARVAGVFVARHAGQNPRLLAPDATLLVGESRIEDRVGATRYVAGAGAFVQAHRAQAARVHDAVAAHVARRKGSQVLDLYAGGGGIGLALARAGARVTLVESHPGAAADARESARLNGVEVEVIALDADRAVEMLVAQGRRFDAVVLNPPRRGCSPSVRLGAALLRPERVAYVSCDPDTLARDLDHFRRLGFVTISACPLDMIPLTEEVETVALLQRAPAPHPEVLHEDDELLAVHKWPDEPVLPRRGAAVSTLERVRGRAAWSRAVPLDVLDEGTSGVCTFVRSPEQLAAWRASAALACFVALLRGQTRASGMVRPAGGAQARHRRVGDAAGQSLVLVTAEQSATDALRRALSDLGHPVIGDGRYGHEPTNRHAAERYTLSRPFLHLARLERTDPRTGAPLVLRAALAPDLRATLARMGAEALVEQVLAVMECCEG